jgi:hypothetical protein
LGFGPFLFTTAVAVGFAGTDKAHDQQTDDAKNYAFMKPHAVIMDL